MNTQNVPMSQPKVPETIGYLERSVNATVELVSEIENRLASVLSPRPPADNATGGKPEDFVPLASRIASIELDVHNVNTALNSILSRLQV